MSSNRIITKALILLGLAGAVIATTFLFAILHHDDGLSKVYFSLIDSTKEKITEKNFIGRYQLVFFGFTSCHYICPTQMKRMTSALNELQKLNVNLKITPVFISVDPERDTPEKTKLFISNFHKDFIGLTGSKEALKSAADSFKAYFGSNPERMENGYQITHSSALYLVDPTNSIIDAIPGDYHSEQIARRINQRVLSY